MSARCYLIQQQGGYDAPEGGEAADYDSLQSVDREIGDDIAVGAYRHSEQEQ